MQRISPRSPSVFIASAHAAGSCRLIQFKETSLSSTGKKDVGVKGHLLALQT